MPLVPYEIIQVIEERLTNFYEVINKEQQKRIVELETENKELKEQLKTQPSATGSTGISEEELIKKLTKIFGEKNFQDGQFVGTISSALTNLPDQVKEVIYKLDDPEQGGLTINDLVKAKQILKDLKPTHVFTGQVGEPHPQTGYGIWTTDILNEFLNASDLKISVLNPDGTPTLDKKRQPIFTPFQVQGKEVEDLDEPNSKYGLDSTGQPLSWLQAQGAFQLPTDITDKDNALDMSQRGTYLLPYFHEKNNYNPNNPSFCNFVETNGKKEIPMHPKGHPEAGAPVDLSGLSATAAGIGKTTKDVNHLVQGGQRNVILICPNGALCTSGSQHHSSWLQTWGCVICQDRDTSSRPKKVFNPITKNMADDIIFKSHGAYPVTLNDLCHWKDENGQLHEKKGLSVLEEPILLAYLVRELWNTEKFKDKDGKMRTGRQMAEARIKLMKEPDKTNYAEWVKIAVSKFIPKDTIIIFDEAHFTTAEYQTMIKETIFLTKKLGFNVRKMSATFKGIPFSTTSTYPRANLYMSSLQPKFTWQDKEYDLNEILRWDKFWIFLPNVENGLNEAQKAIVEKYDLSLVPFNQPFEKSCESISFGMPPSTAMIVDGSKEMGFTPDVGLLITTNILQTSNLQPDWQYSTPINSWNPLASFVQRIARTGRFRPARGEDGKQLDCAVAITISKEMEEFVIKPDVAVNVIRGSLGGHEDAIKKLQGIDDINHLRGSIALANEENGKWGLYPAELVVGATAGAANYPKWGATKPSFRVDPTLLAKHLGTWQVPKLDPDMVRDIMDTMIANYIKQSKPADDEIGQNNFPYEVNVLMKSSLIEDYGLKAERVKQVLNGIIQQRLDEIEIIQKKDDKKIFKQEEAELFKEATALYKLALGTVARKNITVGKEKTKDGKEFWAMKINYKG
jgi:hypothetical protein